jgi:hypothetical protein
MAGGPASVTNWPDHNAGTPGAIDLRDRPISDFLQWHFGSRAFRIVQISDRAGFGSCL